LVAWVIDLFDDIGHGLADLMYAPFGGAGNLSDLGKLLSHAHIGESQALAYNLVAILAGVVAVAVALPLATGLAFAGVLAIFTGLIVLVFRKILIIFLLILAP